MKIAINGFGRIGRNVYRILARQEELEVVAINDIADGKPLAYLLKYDTVMGRFDGEVIYEDGHLQAGTQRSRLTQGREPRELPWRELGVEVVIEATGRFRSRELLEGHLEAGARKVILTVPAKGEIDATLVLGVNDADLSPEHRIVSNASCTTNCLAPMVKVLDECFGLEKGVMTTVHAYTNDQSVADWYHNDLRRSRAAPENTIPTTTGAARAVGMVLPHLNGRLDGMAVRVPVLDGSIVDLVAELREDVSREAINEAMRAAAAEGPLAGILHYSTEAVVSSDIIGNPYSSIFDSLLTRVIGKKSAKVFAWYDNEWGYSNRVVDLARIFHDMEKQGGKRSKVQAR
ncbi:MAG: type I glyceraldehyde-3-phosphate dehydrogenase [Planctomycetota bacterium]